MKLNMTFEDMRRPGGEAVKLRDRIACYAVMVVAFLLGRLREVL